MFLVSSGIGRCLTEGSAVPRLNFTFRPIEVWPRDLTANRRPSRFEASWSSTLELLEREVRALKGASARTRLDLVVQLAVPPGAIRQDGALAKGRSAPEHPGVILSFDGADRQYQFACDQFVSRNYRSTLNGWQTNVRAIALGMEALRMVDRFGISAGGAQYVGFEALGAGRPLPAAGMSLAEAAALIAREAIDVASGTAPFTAAEILAEPAKRQGAFRLAMRRLHPDLGGDQGDCCTCR
jgi:hypothetical protein